MREGGEVSGRGRTSRYARYAGGPDPLAPPYDLGTATYDGSGFVNTGLLAGKGSTATAMACMTVVSTEVTR